MINLAILGKIDVLFKETLCTSFLALQKFTLIKRGNTGLGKQELNIDRCSHSIALNGLIILNFGAKNT